MMSNSIFTLTILALIATTYTGQSNNLFLAALSLTLWLTVVLLIAYQLIVNLIKRKNDK